MVEALFFDIDGTLVSFNTHLIPESTVESLTEFKAKGGQIYISTGRPVAIIDNLSQIEHLIDGYITTNGAYCFVGSTVVSCSPINPEVVREFLSRIQSAGYPCMVVGDRMTAMINPDENSRKVCSLLNIKELPQIDVSRLIAQNVIQLTPIVTLTQEEELLCGLAGVESGRWHAAFTDLTARGVNKALGLERIAQYAGIDIADTMAFGDGGNDIAIVKAAGIGVAMGNAGSELKEVASYITSSVDNDGIRNAMQHFGLI